MPLASWDPGGSPPAVTFTVPGAGQAQEKRTGGGAQEVRHTPLNQRRVHAPSPRLHALPLAPPTKRAWTRGHKFTLVLGLLGDVVQLPQPLLSWRPVSFPK